MRPTLSALIGIVAFGCASGARPVAQRATTISSAPVVYTNGVGAIYVPADLATLTIQFTARGDTPRGAGEASAANINAIRDALIAVGIPSDSMPTGRQWRWWSSGGNQAQMEIRPHRPDTVRFNRRPDSIYVRRVDTTYVVTQTFSARIRDMDLVGPAIDAALDAGAQTISDLSFSRTELREPYLEVLDLATRYARENAEVMAEAQGAQLGRLLDLSTMPLTTEPYRGVQLDEITLRGGVSSRNTATTVVAPEVRVTATVYARWEIVR